ncbi:MAG: hypothetical protein GDA49_02775 [Rhodospirillales bacterium]|nr:hypothetical protein [Rhodospirillales bacterium]
MTDTETRDVRGRTRHGIAGAMLATLLLAGQAEAEGLIWECEPSYLTHGNLTLTETSVTWNGTTINTPMWTSGFERRWDIDEFDNVQLILIAGGEAGLYRFGDKDRVKPSENWFCEQK